MYWGLYFPKAVLCEILTNKILWSDLGTVWKGGVSALVHINTFCFPYPADCLSLLVCPGGDRSFAAVFFSY